MQLHLIDYALIVAYLAFSVTIGVLFTRRGSRSITDFFCSGRSVPWWLAGVSMVATTFAADTPLAVTGIVAKNGIAGNWLWWNFLCSGLLTVFLFARLWRRAEVLTDVEFTELRYSGKPAVYLRGFRALYLAFPINCIIMGWVTIAMQKIVAVSFNCSDEKAWLIIYGLYAVTGVYIIMAGLWAVLATDFFQFFIAMSGSIALAFFSLKAVGGMGGLREGIMNIYGEQGASFFNFLPSFGKTGIGMYPLITFLVMVTVQWWAAWYPGAEPGGGGYVAQRMFSAKNEKHSVLATLLFNVAHYALRPWPWIIVALCSLVLFPNLADPERGYPLMMIHYLGPGFLGLLLVSFLAAFMSTIATQVNWGASYVVNDVYKRFVAREEDFTSERAAQRNYIFVSRVTTFITIIFGLIVAKHMETVKQAWESILALGAGTGLVLILRWYWWRINAWSEISSMIASAVLFAGLTIANKIHPFIPEETAFGWTMLIIVGGSTLTWLLVTFLTRPEKEETLLNFYRKVRPGGIFWRRVGRLAPDIPVDKGLSIDLLNWFLGAVLIYGILFGFGKLILGYTQLGIILTLVGLCGGFLLYLSLSKQGWERLGK